ncbi:MAG: endolytic transglycosylase MltG [Bacteroidetes bacterium]|nr:endolytic transglycosylase MltG [Bacteroidota bacterium]MCH8524198.1 endolytic transglycosylase MltG [Balneolales bacterium]
MSDKKAVELTIAIAVLLVSFMMVFMSRYVRLESHTAFTSDGGLLFLHENVDLPGLITQLREANVDFDDAHLYWAADIKQWSSFRAGRYVLPMNSNYDALLSKLARGEQDPFMARIVGGQDVNSFIARTARLFRFSEDDLRQTMTDTIFLADIEIPEHILIGRMLPNTYEMFWTTTPEQFVRRMLREFDVAVTQRYSERAAELGISIDEAVTLGSIIEWEVRHVDEKRKVSGLYWNRLNNRWRLQADPTVAHALGERRRLFNRDYRIDHPYNTYRIFGLPPGPINNPRLTSVTAALYPEQHNYFFMVASADGSGYHTFTTRYEDHRRESRRWSNWLTEQTRIREAREREELQQGS